MPTPFPATLQEEISRALALPVIVEMSDEEATPAELTGAERALYNRLTHPDRRRAWLLGRQALRKVLRRLNIPTDSAGLQFPHLQLSLSHTLYRGVAVGVPDPGHAAGIGVDWEETRPIGPAIAQKFLRPEELRWVEGLAPARQDAERLRIWTAKEAIFKSDMDNKNQPITGYSLVDPSAREGGAYRHGPGPADRRKIARYASFPTAEGWLSVAAGAHAR